VGSGETEHHAPVLPALACLGLLSPQHLELDRERLLDNLTYGVEMEFTLKMSLTELDVPSRGAWLKELIARYAADEDHPVAHIERALRASGEKRTEEYRAELDTAIDGLRKLWKAQGDAFETDLRFLFAYCCYSAYTSGASSDAFDKAEQVYLDILTRDPRYWPAAYQLAQLHLFTAFRAEDPEIVLDHVERGLELAERALLTNAEVYWLHEVRGQLRQHRLLSSGFDPKDEQALAELIEIWRDWRGATELFEEPAAARACIAVIPASLLLAHHRTRETPSEELEALRSVLIADIEGAVPYDIFAGRASAVAWCLRYAGGARGDVEAEAFARAVELNEDAGILHSIRIVGALEEDDCALASSAADTAKDVDDDNATILAAHARLQCGDREQAEVLLRNRLAEQPSQVLRRGYGILLLHLGKDEEGARELRAVLEEAPDSVSAHFGLGTALALAGDLAGGLEQLKRARELSSKPSDRMLESIELVSAALSAAPEER